jgi:hypothetical protein
MEFAGFSVKARTITLSIIPNEIPMWQYPHQPEMIMWVFHLTNKKQIINR